MSFFRLRTPPGSVWPALPIPELTDVWTAYRELDRSQWLDPETIQKLQLDQARVLLEHAASNVPYYRERFGAAGVVPNDVRTVEDFRKLPILERKTLQERFDDLVATELPPGVLPAGETHTAGTTGVPVKVLLTNESRLWWFALHLRDLEWIDMDPRGSLASIRHIDHSGPGREKLLAGVSLISWDWQLDRLVETGPSFMMDIHQDPRRQLEWLREISADYLVSYPSNLEALARLAADDGKVGPSFRIVRSISETLSEETQASIEATFSARVKNTYSSMEAGYIASPCPEGHGLHVHAESVLLEILDDAGEPCPPGKEGRVVLTTLHNFLTPLVRYEIMDRAAFAHERCPCGRGLPLVGRPVGKMLPMFHLLDGRLKNTSDLAVSMRELGGFRQFQIVQHAPARVTVRVVPDQSWTEDHRTRIARAIESFLEGPLTLSLEVTERIAPSSSGKVQRLVCELDESSQR